MERRRIPRMLALPAYLAVGNLAALHAWSRVVRRKGNAMWEPTRREVLDAS